MTYTISRPTTQDSLELAKVHTQAWLETYPNEAAGISREYIEKWTRPRLSDEGLERRRAAIQKSYDDPNYFLRIARDETGALVGFIDGSIKDGTYWLDGLYTLQSTHGTGLGKQLWDAFLPYTRGHDIFLCVTTYNERAKRFYTKLGFTIVPGSERMFGESLLPIVDMVRKIS